jgi:hypothetical protein
MLKGRSQTLGPSRTEEANGMPMKNPSHPGDFIRTEIIEPAGLSVRAMGQFAVAANLPAG